MLLVVKKILKFYYGASLGKWNTIQ